MLLNYLKGKRFLFSVMCFWASSTFAQQNQTIHGSFSIIGEDDQTKKAFYVQSIEKTDFEKYRLKTKDVVLEFRNGFKLMLSSADKLSTQGMEINTSRYSDDLAPDYIYPLFKIDESGIVVTMHKKKLTKSELKIQAK